MHIHKIRILSLMSYKKSILHSLGHFNDVFDYFSSTAELSEKHLRNLI